jgi:hypothetical protein
VTRFALQANSSEDSEAHRIRLIHVVNGVSPWCRFFPGLGLLPTISPTTVSPSRSHAGIRGWVRD